MNQSKFESHPEKNNKLVSLVLEIIGIGVLILVIIFVIASVSGWNLKKKPKDKILVNDVLANQVNSGMSYAEIKKKNPRTIYNPNISKDEIKKNIVDGSNPTVYDVAIYADEVSPSSVTIKKGDVVTWTNSGKSNVKVVGDEWGSTDFFQPNTSYSQEFDIPGEYKYEAKNETNQSISAVIYVTKE